MIESISAGICPATDPRFSTFFSSKHSRPNACVICRFSARKNPANGPANCLRRRYVASPRESYLPRGEPRGTEAKQALISDKKLLFFVGQIAELDNRDFLLPLPRTAGIRPYRHQGFHQRGEFVAGKRNSTNRAQNVV